MQPHTYLLLLIIKTETMLALLNHHCGGNISLDQWPSGQINLTLPGHLAYTSSPDLKNDQHTVSQPSACSWVLDVPQRMKVLLKLVFIDFGSLTVQCAWGEANLTLRNGDTTLLFNCDQNQATLSWTGLTHSSNIISLVYHVQKNEKNSSDVLSTYQVEQEANDLSQTRPTFLNKATTDQELLQDTERGRNMPGEKMAASTAPRFFSNASPQNEWLLHTTSLEQGGLSAGSVDKETLSLPVKEPHNGAETSGRALLIDDTTSKTGPYFEKTVNPDTSTKRVDPPTEMLQKDTTLNDSGVSPWTDRGTFVSIQEEHHTIQMHENVSHSPSSDISFLPDYTTETEDSTLISHGGAVNITPTYKRLFTWRSQRNTEEAGSHLTFTSTFDPLTLSSKPPYDDSSSENSRPIASVSSSIHIKDAEGVAETTLDHPHLTQDRLSGSTASTVTESTAKYEFESPQLTDVFSPSSQSGTEHPTNSLLTQTADQETHPTTDSRSVISGTNTAITPSLPDSMMDDGLTEAFTSSFSTTSAAQVTNTQNQSPDETTGKLNPLPTTQKALYDGLNTVMPSLRNIIFSTSSYVQSQNTALSDDIQTATVISSLTELLENITFQDQETTPGTHRRLVTPPPTDISPTYNSTEHVISAAYTTKSPTASDHERVKTEMGGDFRIHLNLTPSTVTSSPLWRSTSSPLFYVVPNQPALVKVESVELLLQIIVEEEETPKTAGLEEEASAWMEPYLRRAPGFSKVLGVWNSGQAVQSLVAFRTREALQWLNMTGPTSLLDQTGLSQVVQEGKTFRSSRVTNITLGGLQGDVCGWLLQCPKGFRCVPQPDSVNYSCSSFCHFDYCHHHGICTHHPGQFPVCRCLVGVDFWYMGERCNTKMTQARLVSACMAILLITMTVIGIVAYVAVRRYRDILIQAKVDQTRSSYHRFNHFDELSARFWLRSWAGSADSLDNLGFTRSDELLHLRALDQPCCCHDDTLSLPSTCPSHGTRINTIYPHSSQYGWRGSGVSMGEGVLDSGKASDLSVCSWPVEPIHWTPFPLLQQLASHRPQTVRVTRPRSYCEGMELVDMGKSWTA